MEHALLSASGSSRWLNCPPSARLEEKEADTTSQYAKEGTLAHKIAELGLLQYIGEINKRTHTRRLNKLKKEELFYPGMLEYVQVYIDFVIERYLAVKKCTRDTRLVLERRLDFSKWVPKGFGTGDAIIVTDNIAEIIDFKYGKGVIVSAINNPQMILYALGTLHEYDLLYNIQHVSMTIVQPRLENISTSTLKVSTLQGWGESIKETAKKAYDGEGEFRAGSHCQFCKIKAKCKAYADEQLKLARYDFQEGPYLEDGDIADILKQAKTFKNWLKAVEEFALDQAVNHGQEYPGFKLVEGRSNRQYSDPDKVHKTLLKEGYEEDKLFKPKELFGITAMEKLLGRKTFNELLSSLIIKPPGKPTLVPKNDKRPAWNSVDQARKDFEKN